MDARAGSGSGSNARGGSREGLVLVVRRCRETRARCENLLNVLTDETTTRAVIFATSAVAGDHQQGARRGGPRVGGNY